jgi:hypothetical protein
VYRPLRVYTVDPSLSRFEGATAILNVPYEPVKPGPEGHVIRILGFDGEKPITTINLEDPRVLINSGLTPSPTNHLFHQQMVYAVASSVYAAFRTALGRHLSWGFEGKLQIRPHVADLQNAFYESSNGMLSFGYYQAPPNTAGNIPPGTYIFTCLSHDIIVHELTHALLDGLRSQFLLPTGPDVLAFHEAISDLVAIFQHFTYQEVLETQIQKSKAKLEQARLLTGIAHEFGYTLGEDRPLRSAIGNEKEFVYGETSDEYARASVLVSAMFDAFIRIYERKTDRYIRLATSGSGVLPEGNLSTDLVAILANEAAQLAGQFLSICIRALDYCPPVDVEFGEYLRALITADRDLIPDDKWGYREALIAAFARRKIYPRDVKNLSEDALVWRSPLRPVPPLQPLQFSELRFQGDPSIPASESELFRQACALGEFVSRPENLDNFGFLPPAAAGATGEDRIELPCVQSVRTSRRVGPAGQVVFDLVAEVTQRRLVRNPVNNLLTEFYGAATIIIDPKGEIRYTVFKHTGNTDRLQRQLEFQVRSGLWHEQNGRLVPGDNPLKQLHRKRF